MIAKIMKGNSFKNVVNYVLRDDKDTQIVALDGLSVSPRSMIAISFEAQAMMNPDVSKPVGHIALSFSKEDKHRLSNRSMGGIALEYLDRMGIKDTQILIVRHFDKEHPHVHIVYNRIANDGKTIPDRNERLRSTRICKELTTKYGLHIADGKGNVNRHQLREPDRTRYELHDILRMEVGRCRDWLTLIANLRQRGIGMDFKRKGNTSVIQGVVFTMNGYRFNGSKIDRRFSYSKISSALKRNAYAERQSPVTTFAPSPQYEHLDNGRSGELITGSLGLLTPHGSSEYEEAQFANSLRKKKKKKPGLRL